MDGKSLKRMNISFIITRQINTRVYKTEKNNIIISRAKRGSRFFFPHFLLFYYRFFLFPNLFLFFFFAINHPLPWELTAAKKKCRVRVNRFSPSQGVLSII